MTRPMLEQLRITNFGCIKSAQVTLSPLHALIGPNDSGKSTVLRALRTLSLVAEGDVDALNNTQEAANLKLALTANIGRGETSFSTFSESKTWLVQLAPDATKYESLNGGAAQELNPSTGSSRLLQTAQLASFARAISGSQVLRLEPDQLRLPSGLIPDGQPLRFANEHGLGLPGLYDAVQTRDFEAFRTINEDLRRLFPAVKALRLKNTSTGKKSLGVELSDGTPVSAEFMSEGLLYYLAYAALGHLEQTAMLLIEEPENGLHPARIADVVRALREVSKKTQVIIATHSPLVINELEGHEVSVVTRTAEAGTQVQLLKDTPDFAERSKVYSPGELWLSYADGKEEAALLKGGPRP
ncbi:MAG: hypothetical protein RLZZ450_2440 [Pseudomonadota bacterium]